MSTIVRTLLLLGLVLLLIAPFSALAPLLVLILVPVLCWTVWTIVSTLATGDLDRRES